MRGQGARVGLRIARQQRPVVLAGHLHQLAVGVGGGAEHPRHARREHRVAEPGAGLEQGEHDFPALGVGGADAHIAGAHHRQRRLHLAALVEHLVGAERPHPGQRRHLAQRRLGQPGQQRAAFQYFENVIDHRPDTP